MIIPRKDLVLYGAIVLLVIAIFVMRGCQTAHENRLVKEIADYKTEAQHYKDKFGEVVAFNQTLAVETQDQIKTLLSSNDTLRKWVKSFKDIKAGGVIKETTIIKEVAVPFDKPIPCDFKPFKANKKDPNFDFFGTVSNTGLTIDSLRIPNEARFVIGEKRKGILGLGGSEMRIEVKNSNPLIKVSNLEAYTYTPKKKWYETRLFNIGVGMGLGVLTYKQISK